MTIYFGGTEAEAFGNGGTSLTDSTTYTGNRYSDPWSRAALSLGSGVVAEADPGVGLTDYWIAFYFWYAFTAPSSGDQLVLYDSAGVNRFRISYTASWTIQCAYWNGSAWINIGSSYALSIASQTLGRAVLRVIPGGSGSFELWINGTSVLTGSASMSAFTDLRKAVIHRAGGVNSEIQIADESLVAHRLRTIPATANGADTGGIGAISAINEVPINDTNYLEFTAAGNRRSWVNSNPGVSGTIRALIVTCRAMRVDATGPQKIKPYVLISGTRYYGTTFTLTTSFAPYFYIWETNPATGSPWTDAEINNTAIQKGWEAVA